MLCILNSINSIFQILNFDVGKKIVQVTQIGGWEVGGNSRYARKKPSHSPFEHWLEFLCYLYTFTIYGL